MNTETRLMACWQLGFRSCTLELDAAWAACGLPQVGSSSLETSLRNLCVEAHQIVSEAKLPLQDQIERNLSHYQSALMETSWRLQASHDEDAPTPPWLDPERTSLQVILQHCDQDDPYVFVSLRWGDFLDSLIRLVRHVVAELDPVATQTSLIGWTARFFKAGRLFACLSSTLTYAAMSDEERSKLACCTLQMLEDEVNQDPGPKDPQLSPSVRDLGTAAWRRSSQGTDMPEAIPYQVWLCTSVLQAATGRALQMGRSPLLTYDFDKQIASFCGKVVSEKKLTDVVFRILFALCQTDSAMRAEQISSIANCSRSYQSQAREIRRLQQALGKIAASETQSISADAQTFAEKLIIADPVQEQFKLGVKPDQIRFNGRARFGADSNTPVRTNPATPPLPGEG